MGCVWAWVCKCFVCECEAGTQVCVCVSVEQPWQMKWKILSLVVFEAQQGHRNSGHLITADWMLPPLTDTHTHTEGGLSWNMLPKGNIINHSAGVVTLDPLYLFLSFFPSWLYFNFSLSHSHSLSISLSHSSFHCELSIAAVMVMGADGASMS